MNIVLFTDNIDEYLKEDNVINYGNENIMQLADALYQGASNEVEYIKKAYEYVRDSISHSADINEDILTCSATEVLEARHGICFAKSHLLAALLRYKSIPTGFCYQKLILDDEIAPVLIYHGFNGVYVKEYKKRIVCEMPSVKGDSSVVSFFFEACDNVGMTASCQRSIMVYVGDGGLLKERSGYMLYSPWSGKEDAFSFATLQTIKRSEEALADIYLDPMSENEDDLLCRLIAGTDIVFALSSSYDYAGATWNGLQVVLNSSVRTRTIENFATGDVILVGREEVADSGIKLNTLGVIRIMAVYDEEGKDEDRVVFNLKTL